MNHPKRIKTTLTLITIKTILSVSVQQAFNLSERKQLYLSVEKSSFEVDVPKDIVKSAKCKLFVI